ncbi:MAG: peptidase MA family metallohydrolase [Myxococcota bacterium]
MRPAAPSGRRARVVASALAIVLGGLVAAPAFAAGADGRFEERSSSHFVLLQDVDIDRRHGFHGSRRFEQQVLAVLERGYDDLERRLGLRPRRPMTVFVYDPAVFDREFAGLFRFAAAGFYAGTIRVRGETAVSDRLVRVLHHELVHAAFDAEAPTLVLPAWLNEGVAEWFEARSVGKRRLSGGEWSALAGAAASGQWVGLSALSMPSFSHLGPDGARLAYLESYGFVDFLVRRHGERELRRWCTELLRTRDLSRATRRVFRADPGELERRFVAELVGSR